MKKNQLKELCGTLNELNRLLGDQEEPVEMMMTPAKGQVLFRIRGNDTVEIVSQLLQGAFPTDEHTVAIDDEVLRELLHEVETDV